MEGLRPQGRPHPQFVQAELNAEELRQRTGRTVAVRGVSRLTGPTTGEIAIDGEDLRGMDTARLRELRRHRAAKWACANAVFQHFGLLPHRTVLDSVAYGLEIQGVGKTERRARAARSGSQEADGDRVSGGRNPQKGQRERSRVWRAQRRASGLTVIGWRGRP